jgi:uncharacterized iron-regulated membrane protein
MKPGRSGPQAAERLPRARGIRQTMSELHSWTGLLAAWILYAMFLTGTTAYFREEMSQWMRPELPAQKAAPDNAEVAQRVAGELARLAAGSPQWSITLPDARSNVVHSFWRKPGGGRRGFENGVFDPTTGERLAARETRGGDFFYAFHFNLHYMPPLWGRWIAGACAMLMLLAIVSGVITHKKIFIDFFTFRAGKGQRSWLDAHNILSVFGLPFHLMITYSGLVTMMIMYMPWGADAAFERSAREGLAAETTAFIPAGKPSGVAAPLTAVVPLVREAQARWGAAGVGRVIVNHPGDAAARIVVVRGDAGRVSQSPQYLLFDGRDGRLLQTKVTVGPAAETRGVLYALHLGRFADTVTRWLYFLVSLAGTAMVGTGLVLWTVKRRARLPDPSRPHLGVTLVERLNIVTLAGLSVAMAAFLWGNRLLPTSLADRAAWEIHLFFAVWAAMALHAALRSPRRAWTEQMGLAAALLALLPVLNAFTTGRPLWRSVLDGDWVFAGMELTCLALAALHAMFALRAARAVAGATGQRAPRSAAPADRASALQSEMA